MNISILALGFAVGSHYEGDEVAISRIVAPTLEMDGLTLSDVRATLMISRRESWQRTVGTFRMLGGYGSFSLLRMNGVAEMDAVVKEADVAKIAMPGLPAVPGRIGELHLRVRGDNINVWTRDIRIRGDPVRSITLVGDMERGDYKLTVALTPDGDAVIEGRLMEMFRRLRGGE